MKNKIVLHVNVSESILQRVACSTITVATKKNKHVVSMSDEQHHITKAKY